MAYLWFIISNQIRNMTKENIAKVAHEINKAYCEGIGDNSQKAWEQAEAWQRDSAVKGVDFAINNPNAPVSSQHDAWYQDKLAQGWKYGGVKDPEKKEHPCMVVYEALPQEQKVKDYLFKQTVNSLKNFLS